MAKIVHQLRASAKADEPDRPLCGQRGDVIALKYPLRKELTCKRCIEILRAERKSKPRSS